MSDASGPLWAAVDHLSLPTKKLITRDDGSITHALVLSLWDQADETLFTDAQGGRAGGSLAERNVMDLNLMQVRALIRDTTARELAQRRLTSRPTVPGAIRQLAAHVISNELADLWWWEYRFSSWARQLAHYLRADAHVASIRLRNSPCPACGARQVLVEADDGPVVAPPLVIDFREGYVRAAECTACGQIWFRGEALHALAERLGGLEAA